MIYNTEAFLKRQEKYVFFFYLFLKKELPRDNYLHTYKVLFFHWNVFQWMSSLGKLLAMSPNHFTISCALVLLRPLPCANFAWPFVNTSCQNDNYWYKSCDASVCSYHSYDLRRLMTYLRASLSRFQATSRLLMYYDPAVSKQPRRYTSMYEEPAAVATRAAQRTMHLSEYLRASLSRCQATSRLLFAVRRPIYRWLLPSLPRLRFALSLRFASPRRYTTKMFLLQFAYLCDSASLSSASPCLCFAQKCVFSSPISHGMTIYLSDIYCSSVWYLLFICLIFISHTSHFVLLKNASLHRLFQKKGANISRW